MQLTDAFPDLYFKFRDRPWQKTTGIWFCLGAIGRCIQNFDSGLPIAHSPPRILSYAIVSGIGGYFYHFIRIKVLQDDYYEKICTRQQLAVMESEMLRRGLVSAQPQATTTTPATTEHQQ